ncbi:hypothetical protein Q9966_011858 [Columba livia]|nr:hypothetical protein Q9966_011858 [Columba livia]
MVTIVSEASPTGRFSQGPLDNQQNLGDIFQNQWGLSFIDKPSAGPETVMGKSVDNQLMEVTFQGEYPSTLVSRCAEIIPSGTEQPLFPKAYELDKRTSP